MTARTVVRIALGSALVLAGVAHLTFAREGFRAQVPDFVPFEKDEVVLMSGIAELALGGSLIVLSRERRKIGWIAAAFFAAIFPGNLEQWWKKRSGLGLDTDAKRAARLPGQALLIAAALWSTADG